LNKKIEYLNTIKDEYFVLNLEFGVKKNNKCADISWIKLEILNQ
jgi:hypothetical protein